MLRLSTMRSRLAFWLSAVVVWIGLASWASCELEEAADINGDAYRLQVVTKLMEMIDETL